MRDRLLAVSAVLCAGIALWSGPRDGSLGTWLVLALFVGWVILPLLLVRNLARSDRETEPRSATARTLRAVQWVFAIGTPLLYGQTLFGHQHSTAGLIFAFLPLYQLLLVGGVVLFGGWLERRTGGP
jgi:hypothetical protein